MGYVFGGWAVGAGGGGLGVGGRVLLGVRVYGCGVSIPLRRDGRLRFREGEFRERSLVGSRWLPAVPAGRV